MAVSLRGVRTLTIALTVAACGGGSTDPSPRNGTLTLGPALEGLVTGSTAQLQVEARAATGEVVSGVTPTIVSDNPLVASVSASGLLTATGEGTTRVRATASGFSEATLGVTVNPGALLQPAGGTHSVASLGVVLVVPAGAVSTPTVLFARTAAVSAGDPAMIANSHIELAPAAGALTLPIEVRMQIPSTGRPFGLPASALAIRRREGTGYVNVPGAVDEASGRVTGTVTVPAVIGIGRRVPTVPCSAAEHRQFDFWLGTWDVFVGTSAVATSTITSEPGGCAVYEDFRPNSGVGGRSISFYVPETGRWYQTYLADGGGRLELSGAATGSGMMVLRTSGATLFERWTWTLLSDGRVTQVSQVSNDGGNTFLPPGWNATYRRR